MIDRYTSLSDVMSKNPNAAGILMSYGIPCYGHTENQLSSLEDIGIRYGLDIDSVLNEMNSGLDNGMNNMY